MIDKTDLDKIKELIYKWEYFGEGAPFGIEDEYKQGFENGRMNQALQCVNELQDVLRDCGYYTEDEWIEIIENR